MNKTLQSLGNGKDTESVSQYKDADITYKIIGCAMEVHKILGNGYQEVIYQRALAIELRQQKINCEREVEMPISYKEISIGSRRVDFLIENRIVVEIKAVINLEDAHLAQGLNYLEVFNFEIGLLINFGTKSLQYKRLLNKKYKAIK